MKSYTGLYLFLHRHMYVMLLDW